MRQKNIIKLNLGSGPSGIENWLNFDWGILPLLSKLSMLRKIIISLKLLNKEYDIKWPKIKLVDIRKRFPFNNSTVDYIYCSHVLEHFYPWETVKILGECKRVLKNNGRMRIVVPDIKKMTKKYLETRSHLSKNSESRPGLELCRLWWGYNKDQKPINLIQKIKRLFIRDHQWNYDFAELSNILKEVGFSKIKESDFLRGKFPDIDKLDLPHYQDHSLYIEIIKS